MRNAQFAIVVARFVTARDATRAQIAEHIIIYFFREKISYITV